jgi:type II secretion system protein L
MQTLIINIKALDSEYLDYAVLENDSVDVRLARGTWETVLKKTRARKVIVTIPTEQIFLSDVLIPSRNKKQLKQAIPFALEDHLIEEVETLHFVSHTPNNSQKTQVAVINQALLQQWIDLLRTKKLYGTTLLPDVFLLKYKPQQWTLAVQGERALLRIGQFSGFSCPIDILAVLLNNQLNSIKPAEADASASIERLISYSDTPLTLDLIDTIEHEAHPSEEVVCAKSVLASLPLNLNQGIVTQGGLSKHIHWPSWRLAMFSISLCLVAYLSFISIKNQQLNQENTLLRTQAKQIFLKTFNKRRTVVNPRVEMQAELQKLRKSSGKIDAMYMVLLHRLGQLLSKDKKIQIKSIRYRERELTVVLNGSNVSQLEKLKQKMRSLSPMYQVTLRSIASNNRQVSATLVIKEKS